MGSGVRGGQSRIPAHAMRISARDLARFVLPPGGPVERHTECPRDGLPEPCPHSDLGNAAAMGPLVTCAPDHPGEMRWRRSRFKSRGNRGRVLFLPSEDLVGAPGRHYTTGRSPEHGSGRCSSRYRGQGRDAGSEAALKPLDPARSPARRPPPAVVPHADPPAMRRYSDFEMGGGARSGSSSRTGCSSTTAPGCRRAVRDLTEQFTIRVLTGVHPFRRIRAGRSGSR
jgi:hypothetical protein